MKSIFQNPEIEIVRLHASDIIVTSSSINCSNPSPDPDEHETEMDDIG